MAYSIWISVVNHSQLHWCSIPYSICFSHAIHFHACYVPPFFKAPYTQGESTLSSRERSSHVASTASCPCHLTKSSTFTQLWDFNMQWSRYSYGSGFKIPILLIGVNIGIAVIFDTIFFLSWGAWNVEWILEVICRSSL